MLCVVGVSTNSHLYSVPVNVEKSVLTSCFSRVLLNVLYCVKVNRDKAAGKYDKYKGLGDDREPSFKMVI